MNRLYIRVSGNVQGVGFRYFVYYNATKHSITGWVRNLYDGDVEMEIQANEIKLKIMLDEIKKGTSFSTVENIDVKYIDVKKEKKFTILN